LELVEEGATHREIATMLHITQETARTHTRNIRRKLNAKSNRQLRRRSSPGQR
jgi:DNA-binding CsgD family transcriptional regulator